MGWQENSPCSRLLACSDSRLQEVPQGVRFQQAVSSLG
jgi:hypothetical protein